MEHPETAVTGETMASTQANPLRDHDSTTGCFGTQAALHRKTLLLAEDDEDLRMIMECCLSAMGYVVLSCADAYLASAAFHAHTIDALLTDYQMPGKTGLELARELTGLQPKLPVVVITGSLLSTEILQEIQDRHWIYLRKPSNMSVIESTLAHLINGRQSLAA
jgi:DNA-binding NtrC family response regulator